MSVAPKRSPKKKCIEFKGVPRINYQSLMQNDQHGVHDIEDLVKFGKKVRGCPYFASWKMLEAGAQLVFCPYSYIVDPVIRRAVERYLNGAIIIFDEAHNMEDICREAASINLEEETIFKLHNELDKMSVEEPEIYQPLFAVVDGLISWIGRKTDSLAKRDPELYFSGWTGDKALTELKEFNITQVGFPILLQYFHQVIHRSEEAEPDMPHLSGISVSTLEELFATLGYFFSKDRSHILDYELGLQRSTKRGDSSGTSWTHTFSLWCMNPSVVFNDLADLSLSIILTSGTLSPMDSFSSELGTQFGTCLEAPHVIDANLQVWAGAISNGPGNYALNASYKTADAYTFQDVLGKSLEEIFTIVPAGSLVFFPSYKLMEKLCRRWRETEPRGEAKDEFESVLKGFYDCIRGKKRLIGRNIRFNKAGEAQNDSKKGAAFLVVCRGKVSEGLDFNDDNARAVIIVGIPFPNLHDILVELKIKYNDTHKSSKNLLGGSEWYCQQAYRALNQAAGRCIRHRFDYGAIIFLDERYRQPRNRASISKWLRHSIKLYDNFEASMEGLRSFFNTVKERVDSKMFGSQGFTVEQNSSSENQIQNKSSHVEEPKEDITGSRKMVDVEDYTSSNSKHRFMNESKGFLDHNNDWKPKIAEAKCYKEVIDLECEVQPEPGCCEVSSVTNCDEDPDTSFVKETFAMINGISKNESYGPATGLKSLDQILKQHKSTANFRRSPLGAESSANSTLEAESPLNMSVNSHALKRRKFTSSPVIDLEQGNSNAPSTRPMDHTSLTRRIEFGFGSTETRSGNYNPEVDQRVRISCLLCASPLGRPENNSYLKCSFTRSSKTYLLSLLKETSGTGSAEMPTSVSVIKTDCSLVNQRICRSFESSEGQGIWCKQDGCVFNTIFCPFCSIRNTCLGVQVMATDSSNVQFLSKILFFADQVDVTEDAASKGNSVES